MNRTARRLRGYFLTGILVLLPITVTVYVLWTTFRVLDSITNVFVEFWFGQRIPGLGFLISLILVTLAGMIAANVAGRHLIAFAERLVRRIPLVSTIYTSVKQLVEAFSLHNREAFSRVVMVEYPRRGIFSIGFVANRAYGQLQDAVGEETLCLFVPTAPNPTSGYLILVPEKDCVTLNLSIEEAFKLIVSGGLLLPNLPPQKAQHSDQQPGTGQQEGR